MPTNGTSASRYFNTATKILSSLFLTSGLIYAVALVFHLPKGPLLPFMLLLCVSVLCAYASVEIERRRGKNASATFDLVFFGIAAALLAWSIFSLCL